MQGRYIALAVLTVVCGIAAGILVAKTYFLSAQTGGQGPEILYWVAPMDPNFRKDGPGKSPMGMDLIPVYDGEEPTGDPEEIKLDAREINAIGVRTATARIEEISNSLETVGFVTFDEHATSHIHTRVEGWIERLNVRAVGDRVKKGDLLFVLYAPDITIASSEIMRGYQRNDPREIEVARRKLRNYGVTERQIEEMARDREPAQHLRVYSPQDGVVIDMEAADGMYLKPDVRAISLSDLSSVWLIVDVFERDIARLTSEMKAYARFEHQPGRVFEGTVDYIYPQLDAKTRTLPVRLRFDNVEGGLRPNMFANVSLIPQQSREAITVPTEAVIRTGRAERVILKTGEGTFRPRLVTTGLSGTFSDRMRTEIVQGLQPGEEVVASAQFLIDSESALNAGLLRMAPTEHDPAMGKGTLVSLNITKKQAVIAHDPIAALDWPAMETTFAIRHEVDLQTLVAGEQVRFEMVRGADGFLSLSRLSKDDGVEARGTGVIHAVTQDGKLTLSHEPIPALGWPSMKMDLDVVGLDPSTAPLEEPVEFDLVKDDQGMYAISRIVRVGKDMEAPSAPEPVQDEAEPVLDLMRTSGTINAIDRASKTANITHGPLKEIGMPGMTMDFAISEKLKAEDLPMDQEVIIVLEKGADFSLTLVGVEDQP